MWGIIIRAVTLLGVGAALGSSVSNTPVIQSVPPARRSGGHAGDQPFSGDRLRVAALRRRLLRLVPEKEPVKADSHGGRRPGKGSRPMRQGSCWSFLAILALLLFRRRWRLDRQNRGLSRKNERGPEQRE